jgi:hypothetical protein
MNRELAIPFQADDREIPAVEGKESADVVTFGKGRGKAGFVIPLLVRSCYS